MDKASQEQVIEKHGKQLKELADRIPGYFEEKDIHEWRVEYKKLRAFLRMITADINGHVPLINDETKKIYSVAGTIRELQLYQVVLKSNQDIDLEKLPVYEALLHRKLFTAKEEFIKRTDIYWYEKELDRWRVMAPDYLSVDIVKKFLQQKVTAIRLIMLAPDSEKSLHSYRKHLKDIIYNIKVFTNQWGIPFPVTAWKNEKLLAGASEDLGNFNDHCTSLSFLEPEYTEQLPSEEKIILNTFYEKMLADKNNAQQQLIEKLKTLHFNPEVRLLANN